MNTHLYLSLLLFFSPSLTGNTGVDGCYRFDHFGKKQFVACLCKCTTSHPQCIWCRHYHEPRNRLELTTTPDKKDEQKISAFTTLSMEQAMNNLVLMYKKMSPH